MMEGKRREGMIEEKRRGEEEIDWERNDWEEKERKNRGGREGKKEEEREGGKGGTEEEIDWGGRGGEDRWIGWIRRRKDRRKEKSIV